MNNYRNRPKKEPSQYLDSINLNSLPKMGSLLCLKRQNEMVKESKKMASLHRTMTHTHIGNRKRSHADILWNQRYLPSIILFLCQIINRFLSYLCLWDLIVVYLLLSPFPTSIFNNQGKMFSTYFKRCPSYSRAVKFSRNFQGLLRTNEIDTILHIHSAA